MAFDAEVFLKQGLMPMFGGTQDIIGANLQSALARMRHQQEMQQLQEMYKLRGEEQGKAHEQTMAEMAERERLATVEDAMERNRILLRSSSDLWAAEKGAQIHMRTTKYEEGLKHKYTEMEENLRQLGDKNPAKLDEIYSNSIKNNMASLAILDESDAAHQQEYNKALALANMDPRSVNPPSPAELEEANKILTRSKHNLDRNAEWRRTINDQVKNFTKIGVTDSGNVPKDRQGYLKNIIKQLEDKMGYRGMMLGDLKGPEVLTALQTLEKETGTQLNLNEADLQFLLANYWEDLLDSFKSSVRKPQQ